MYTYILFNTTFPTYIHMKSKLALLAHQLALTYAYYIGADLLNNYQKWKLQYWLAYCLFSYHNKGKKRWSLLEHSLTVAPAFPSAYAICLWMFWFALCCATSASNQLWILLWGTVLSRNLNWNSILGLMLLLSLSSLHSMPKASISNKEIKNIISWYLNWSNSQSMCILSMNDRKIEMDLEP